MKNCLNYNAEVLYPFYKALDDKAKNNDFLIDKSGCKIVELIAPTIEFDMNLMGEGFIDFESRKSPRKYIEKEKEWYLSKSLSIDAVKDVKIWTQVCNADEEINSNYGYLVFSKGNFSQFANVVKTLKEHKDSRQAIIIYTRPSIQYEHNALGGSDFICTNYQQFFIRNEKLHCVTSMRSNDCWTGTFSDIPWFLFVAHKLLNELSSTYPKLELGNLKFIPNSFHCYERNFEKLDEMVN